MEIMKMRSSKPIHIVLILALIASVIILVAIPIASTVKCLHQQTNWVKTQGSIVDHWKKYETHSKQSYVVRYCKVTYTLDEEVYTSVLSDTSVRDGEHTLVVYINPENPEEAISAEAIETRLLANVMGSIITIAISVSVVVMALKDRNKNFQK